MDLTFITGKPETTTPDSLIVFVNSFEKLTDRFLRQLDENSNGALTIYHESGEFSGAEKEIVDLMAVDDFAANRVILVGVGKKAGIKPDNYRRAAGLLSRHSGFKKSERVSVFIPKSFNPEFAQAIHEGLLLGGYRFEEFKGRDKSKTRQAPDSIEYICADSATRKKVAKSVERGRILAEGQNLVRDLAGTPSNFLTPIMLAKRAEKLAKEYKFSCRAMDEKEITKEKMGALLSVTRGSKEPARFIIMKYNGGRSGQAPIVLIGKGVTFDTGGISLKQALNMHEMKGDMTGSAVVIATMVTAARLKLPLNIVGLVPTTENMPSATATKPGDIVTARNGVTIEVINTDAEGRLILADALDYANTFKPQAVIDIATLTGASLFIVGYAGAPYFANNKSLQNQIESASSNCAERVWNMPIWDEFRDGMKSSVADLVNSGGRDAGTCKAAAFLENFIGDYPWAHIDIAYVDVEPKGRPYIPKGSTGIGLRLLTDLLSNWKKLGK